LQVRRHAIEGRGHEAQGTAGQDNPFIVEAAHEHRCAPTEGAEHPILRDPAVVEDQLPRFTAAHAELVELLRAGEAGVAALD
jgi:hypothetical protein